MERAELIERLKGYEWTDVEFKEARRGVPDSAYETVSAFSNTEGGWLVFGVRDGAGGFEIAGVLEVDKVQNDPPTPDLPGRQVGEPTPDLPTRQVGEPTTDLPTRQVGEPTPDLPTGQVGEPTPDLPTRQVGPPTPDLVTDQVDQPRENLVSDQVDGDRADLSGEQVESLTELSATQWKILEYCDVPRSLMEIVDVLGFARRDYFKKHHLDPLIRAGIVAMTNPGHPRASNQRYVVTDAGARLKARRTGAGAGTRGGG